MPIQEDSLTGIFDALREGAMTLQQGGGVGYDFSVLRPHGFSASHTGQRLQGPFHSCVSGMPCALPWNQQVH